MKNPQKIKQSRRRRRIRRARAKIFGVKTRPRLIIYRSLKHLYAQIIDDEKGRTLTSVSDFELSPELKKKNKTERAKEIGILLTQKLKDKKINKVVFDRRGYKYHGVVKAFAEAVRQGGIHF